MFVFQRHLVTQIPDWAIQLQNEYIHTLWVYYTHTLFPRKERLLLKKKTKPFSKLFWFAINTNSSNNEAQLPTHLCTPYWAGLLASHFVGAFPFCSRTPLLKLPVPRGGKCGGWPQPTARTVRPWLPLPRMAAGMPIPHKSRVLGLCPLPNCRSAWTLGWAYLHDLSLSQAEMSQQVQSY